ncbi:MAG: hypothetical protein KAI99_23310, partial [Cyclobacteriaceae bacterium]|nr:hypothetical protein [Cyclobacteriaceae bacterium]
MNNNRLYYQLNIIFILLLLFPFASFLYFGYKYNLLHDNYIKFFSLIGLVYIFVGFTLLRRMFDHIINISQNIKDKIAKDL